MATVRQLRSSPPLKLGPSFAQHRRLDRLRDLLARHPGGVTLYQLAEMLEVAPRTMRRYLKEIEREYELSPLRPRGGGPCLWRIRPSELPRKVEMRRAQAYALLATRRVFDALQGSALFDEIDMAVSKLRTFADRPGRGPNAGLANVRLEDRFVYLPRLTRDNSEKSEELDELFLAVSELHPLSLRYAVEDRPRPARDERFVIHPYALVLYGDCVHCVGCHVPSQEIRTFAVDRMRDAHVFLDERFELPPQFRLEEHFRGEFGALAPQNSVKVVVELDARAARSVRDVKWHPSQKTSSIAGGGARVSFAVEDPELLASWVLGFGSGAQVLEPESLRDMVRQELEAALESYGGGAPRDSAAAVSIRRPLARRGA
ncbi:MAG TPA: WYL domain-containing protein [Polyangiaceae bacterium]|nr:WYL domain-containing protein [Polyangiaceae bacterium]